MPLLQGTIEKAREHLLCNQPIGFLQGDGWFSHPPILGHREQFLMLHYYLKLDICVYYYVFCIIMYPHKHIYIYVWIYIYEYMNICVYVCMCVCMYVSTYTYIIICIYIYVLCLWIVSAHILPPNMHVAHIWGGKCIQKHIAHLEHLSIQPIPTFVTCDHHPRDGQSAHGWYSSTLEFSGCLKIGGPQIIQNYSRPIVVWVPPF